MPYCVGNWSNSLWWWVVVGGVEIYFSVQLNFKLNNKRLIGVNIRGEGQNSIYELGFWHPGGTSTHKNKALDGKQKSLITSNLPPTSTKNV